MAEHNSSKKLLQVGDAAFRTMFVNHSAVMYIVDLSDFSIIDANPAALDFYGYDRRTMLTKRITDLNTTPEDEIRAEIQNAIKEGRSFYIFKHRLANGAIRDVEIYTNPVTLGDLELSFSIVHDITERKNAEEALHQSEVTFRKLFSDSSDAILLIDSAGIFVECNQAALDLLKMTRQQFLLLTPARISPEFQPDGRRSAESASEMIALAYSKGLHRFDWTCVNAEGNKFIVEVSLMPIVIKGQTMLHTAWRDITARKVSEEALLAATQVAEAANHAKSLFLAKVSHEIRTPLTAIVGYGELMEDAELTSKDRKYLSAINAASNTLSLLIDDIIDLSKIDAGELIIRQENFRLSRLFEQLAKDQEQQIAKKNLLFNVSMSKDIPDLLVGDPLRIQQILLNLLGNAIKFTGKGSISLDVSVVEEGDFRVLLDVSVKDTGIGIAADFQERIFVPFVQALGPSSHQYSGSGLGLSISRSLAGLMGGTVELESQEGVGSTFHLLIPLRRTLDDISNDPHTEIEPLPRTGPALNILLAEDNQINIQFIKTILEKLGHKVMTAENGKVALDQLITNVFDLVLMDIQMPVMNGIDALKALRELEHLSGKHLTVIALTAYALIGDQEKFLKMGFDGYLKKPFTTRELVKKLSRLVPG